MIKETVMNMRIMIRVKDLIVGILLISLLSSLLPVKSSASIFENIEKPQNVTASTSNSETTLSWIAAANGTIPDGY